MSGRVAFGSINVDVLWFCATFSWHGADVGVEKKTLTYALQAKGDVNI